MPATPAQAAVRAKVWRAATQQDDDVSPLDPDNDRITFKRRELRELWDSILADTQKSLVLEDLMREATANRLPNEPDIVYLVVGRVVYERAAKLV